MLWSCGSEPPSRSNVAVVDTIDKLRPESFEALSGLVVATIYGLDGCGGGDDEEPRSKRVPKSGEMAADFYNQSHVPSWRR